MKVAHVRWCDVTQHCRSEGPCRLLLNGRIHLNEFVPSFIIWSTSQEIPYNWQKFALFFVEIVFLMAIALIIFFGFEFCNKRTIYGLSTKTKFPWVGNLDLWCFKLPLWLSVTKNKGNRRESKGEEAILWLKREPDGSRGRCSGVAGRPWR